MEFIYFIHFSCLCADICDDLSLVLSELELNGETLTVLPIL